MKKVIESYFRHDRSYETGVKLIQQYSVNMSLKKQVNVYPQSKYIIGVIHEELRHIGNISRDDLKDILALPVVPVKVDQIEDIAVEKPADPHPEPEKPKKVNRKK